MIGLPLEPGQVVYNRRKTSGSNHSLTHITVPLLFDGPGSFPRSLPAESDCPQTEPPPASSDGRFPSPARLETLGLGHPQTSVRLPPPVGGLLGHPDLLAHLDDRLPLGLGHLRLSQLDDDLLGRKPLPGQPSPPATIQQYSFINWTPWKEAGQ